MMWHDGWNGGTWVIMGFLMLVFWSLVAAAVLWLTRDRRDRLFPTSESHTARPELDARFARGEITEDDFQERRDALSAR